MIVPKIPVSSKINPFLLKIDNFRGGTNTLVNPARLRNHFAVETNNLFQVEDGLWKTRPGIDYYGNAVSGENSLDGACEYEREDGTRELIVIGGTTGKIYKSTNNGQNWSQISGATLTPGNRPYFAQIGNKLYISNGVDNFTIYNGASLVQYTSIPAPGTPNTALTGLTTGNYNNYYRIVAINEIGYTTPSPARLQTTNKHRELWDNSNYVTVTWSAVSGADAYQIFWGEFDGEETLIGVTTTTSFIDTGEANYPHNPYVETPNDNTTAAPKFRVMEISGNRLWATYDSSNKWRVYFSGTGRYFLTPAFSPFYGGGYIDLEKGGKNKPIALTHYRTGKGDPIMTVFCSSADGNGTIFQIDLTTVTIGTETATAPMAYKIVGAVGADAPASVVKVKDDVFFVNKKGIFTLRNKEQIFNVLSNDDLTAPIRNKFESISQNKIHDIVGYYRPPRVFFSLSEGGAYNDKVIIFDLERGNWTWSWSFGFKQAFEYTDTSGTTHFLIVPANGGRLSEISERHIGDYGQSFYQSYISPLIPVSKDLTEIAKIKEVIFEIGRVRGEVIMEVLGLTADKNIIALSSKIFRTTIGTSGWSDDLFSDFLFSETNDVPRTFAEDTTKQRVSLGKKLYAIQFKISSNRADSVWQLLSIQAKGYLMSKKAPSQWN